MVTERLTIAEIQGKLIGKSATNVLGYYKELKGAIILEDGIPLDLVGLYVDSAGVIRRKDSPADIEVSRKVKSLAAGANNDTHDYSSHAVRLFWISAQNPDAAGRVMYVSLRNASDVVVTEFGRPGPTSSQNDSRYQINPNEYYFFGFPGGLEIPYNYDLRVDWIGMTGGNTSIHSTGYRWLNDQ